MVISEVLTLNPEIDELIAISATRKEIITQAKKYGFITFR